MFPPNDAWMTAHHSRPDQMLRLTERVAAHVKRDHATIRALLDMVERACLAAKDRQSGLESFRRAVWDLYLSFQEHLAMEEADLVPLLRKDGAAGEVRATEMLLEHDEQHRLILELVEDTECDVKDNDALVAQALALVHAFRTDMTIEERSVALLVASAPASITRAR